MPTWVPDWRMMTFAPIAYDPWREEFAFSASGNSHSQQKITSEDLESISLRGTMVDTLKDSGSIWHPNWLGSLDPDASYKYLSEIRAFCSQSFLIDLEDEETEASRIAIADWDRAGYLGFVANGLDSYRRLLKEFAESNTTQQRQSIYDSDTWYRRAMQLLRSCRPFISHSGLIGLAPPHAQVDDIICIFLGGQVPYVLRKESDKVYSLVGEAYVHGIMYGEYMKSCPNIKTFRLK